MYLESFKEGPEQRSSTSLSMSCTNQIHNISFCDTNDVMIVPAQIQTGSDSGTWTHRLLDPVVLRMVETGVQDSGAKAHRR